jgi:hypothetical protein
MAAIKRNVMMIHTDVTDEQGGLIIDINYNTIRFIFDVNDESYIGKSVFFQFSGLIEPLFQVGVLVSASKMVKPSERRYDPLAYDVWHYLQSAEICHLVGIRLQVRDLHLNNLSKFILNASRLYLGRFRAATTTTVNKTRHPFTIEFINNPSRVSVGDQPYEFFLRLIADDENLIEQLVLEKWHYFTPEKFIVSISDELFKTSSSRAETFVRKITRIPKTNWARNLPDDKWFYAFIQFHCFKDDFGMTREMKDLFTLLGIPVFEAVNTKRSHEEMASLFEDYEHLMKSKQIAAYEEISSSSSSSEVVTLVDDEVKPKKKKIRIIPDYARKRPHKDKFVKCITCENFCASAMFSPCMHFMVCGDCFEILQNNGADEECFKCKQRIEQVSFMFPCTIERSIIKDE